MTSPPVLPYRLPLTGPIIAILMAVGWLHLAALRDAGLLAPTPTLLLALAPFDWLSAAIFGSRSESAVYFFVWFCDVIHAAETFFAWNMMDGAAGKGVVVGGAVRLSYAVGTFVGGFAQIATLKDALKACARAGRANAAAKTE
jgi:hypothetical protein